MPMNRTPIPKENDGARQTDEQFSEKANHLWPFETSPTELEMQGKVFAFG